MNKEFPVDKWFRKHVSPWRMIVAAFSLMALMIYGPSFITHYTVISMAFMMNAMIIVLALVMNAMVGLFAWKIYWDIKYKPKVEYCKECDRPLPIKYED